MLAAGAFGNCPGQEGLRPNPTEPLERGPYGVAARTIAGGLTDRNLTIEVWYPTEPPTGGTNPAASPCFWDIRGSLPEEQAAKVPDPAEMPCSAAAVGTCCNPSPIFHDCARDLEIVGDGVFPLMVFVHGTGGFRWNSASIIHLWVSRGWVVVSADYPGIWLHDLVSLATNPFVPVPPIEQEEDTRKLMRVIDDIPFGGGDPRLDFLRGRIDARREQRAISGHSAGAFVSGRLGDTFGIVIPMAGNGVDPDPRVNPPSSLILGAENDSVVVPRQQRQGYDSTDPPKRLVIAAGVGHQFCSDLCVIGRRHGGLIKVARECGILIAGLLPSFGTDGCQFVDGNFAAPEQGWRVIEKYSVAVMEETARCDRAMTARFAAFERELGGPAVVTEFKEALADTAGASQPGRSTV